MKQRVGNKGQVLALRKYFQVMLGKQNKKEWYFIPQSFTSMQS